MDQEKKYSYLYKEIVEDENDMVGHIAYSLYKTSKIEFIENFKKDNDSTPPTEVDLENFHRSIKTVVPTLRFQAEQILSDFTQFTLEETISSIEEQLIENQDQRLQRLLDAQDSKVKTLLDAQTTKINAIATQTAPKSQWHKFHIAILVSLTKTLVVTFIMFLFIFSVSAKDSFVDSLIKLFFKPTIENNNQKPITN
ncbi:hypothetical protein [Myroides odoratimimus]|uniref:hypothetical protein n=1 Tax=Myroides odoratimimus TaxID=76832 RepID=UPI00046A0DED|nr:hypothetical protein [Myroides odoratimimus]